MDMDITGIFEAALALVAMLAGRYLIPWLRSKLDASRQQELAYWLSVAVRAAEEYFKDSGKGQEKTAYVREFLAKKGYCLDEKEVAALTDSMVWELINQFQQNNFCGGGQKVLAAPEAPAEE